MAETAEARERRLALHALGKKYCRECDTVKPHGDFHRRKAAWDGRVNKCRDCSCTAAAKYHVENRDERLEYQRGYRETHRDEMLASQREYREANRDKLREDSRAYYHANKDEKLAYDREYYRANRDEVLERNRGRYATRTAEDPFWVRLRTGRKRAREAGTEVENFSSDQLTAYWSENGLSEHECYLCEGEITEADPLEVDHATPISRGGGHTLDNCKPAHRSCNQRKSDSTAEEFLTGSEDAAA